ncbi:hypothetical protein BD779DRAFT_1524250 [Infundibulicybe gibba]|nr:hypothetical protein BD779DRAFT_1524250 [Infundibulicybe gibba]
MFAYGLCDVFRALQLLNIELLEHIVCGLHLVQVATSFGAVDDPKPRLAGYIRYASHGNVGPHIISHLLDGGQRGCGGELAQHTRGRTAENNPVAFPVTRVRFGQICLSHPAAPVSMPIFRSSSARSGRGLRCAWISLQAAKHFYAGKITRGKCLVIPWPFS